VKLAAEHDKVDPQYDCGLRPEGAQAGSMGECVRARG
jgi:hypothetical protein